MEVLVIDNYDSFTFNLVHYLEELGAQVTVWRNDQFGIDQVNNFQKILLSPGPGLPDDAGLLKLVISTYAAKKSILGICLGQQAIAEVFGGQLYNLPQVYHGVSSPITITHRDEVLFKNLPDHLVVGRYHSWVAANPLPPVLLATSVDQQGNIMSLQHISYDLRGVQFHPESVLTPTGKAMLKNWLYSSSR